MANMTKVESINNQYSDKEKLSIRLNLYKKYGTNPMSYQDWLYEFYPLFEGCRILELGCGTGVFWEGKIDKLPEGSSIILSDYSEGMLDVVKGKFCSNNKVSFKQIDIQDIPFDDNTFDLVIANSMLYHVPDIPTALSEVHRVMKQGGTLISATVGEKGLNYWMHHKLKGFNPQINAFEEGRHSFTMQNGAEILQRFFLSVESKEYENSINVIETKDFIEYIRSTIGISGITEDQLQGMFEFFEDIRKKDGAIHIPIDAGTFVSKK